MSPQHLQLTSASLCSLFRKLYGVKNYEINFCRWIGVNDDEFWEEFSDSVVQMLCKLSKRKLQLTDNQLTAISLCCLGRIRTLTGGTRIRRATITPQGKVCFAFAIAKLRGFAVSAKFFRHYFWFILTSIRNPLFFSREDCPCHVYFLALRASSNFAFIVGLP